MDVEVSSPWPEVRAQRVYGKASSKMQRSILCSGLFNGTVPPTYPLELHEAADTGLDKPPSCHQWIFKHLKKLHEVWRQASPERGRELVSWCTRTPRFSFSSLKRSLHFLQPTSSAMDVIKIRLQHHKDRPLGVLEKQSGFSWKPLDQGCALGVMLRKWFIFGGLCGYGSSST